MSVSRVSDRSLNWRAWVDPRTAAQLKSRAVVAEAMGMIKICSGLDRDYLRESIGSGWHVAIVAWLTRGGLNNARALHDVWSGWGDGQRCAWDLIVPRAVVGGGEVNPLGEGDSPGFVAFMISSSFYTVLTAAGFGEGLNKPSAINSAGWGFFLFG